MFGMKLKLFKRKVLALIVNIGLLCLFAQQNNSKEQHFCLEYIFFQPTHKKIQATFYKKLLMMKSYHGI